MLLSLQEGRKRRSLVRILAIKAGEKGTDPLNGTDMSDDVPNSGKAVKT